MQSGPKPWVESETSPQRAKESFHSNPGVLRNDATDIRRLGFGATGDLAYKKIFPALQRLAKRGELKKPVIGVAKSGWNLDQLKQRAKASVEEYGGLDPDGFAKLMEVLRYIDGDYVDPATFQQLRKELGDAQHPIHYLAIPPSLFGEVVKQLKAADCTRGARVVVEKPFGRDLASAKKLSMTLHSVFNEPAIFRID